ncbi:solute carrier organic anion transporter family member [Plakobranchus ocellatus]|uniref:Solute carrier organic anion transporter family member n=1 Tax=Plakobranchus ocellatus TaxID=259542 RepID=A0AAV4B298_9GAST|nr:solute carrier organic anion transporter family member [Plakobranchus ocellatus]
MVMTKKYNIASSPQKSSGKEHVVQLTAVDKKSEPETKLHLEANYSENDADANVGKFGIFCWRPRALQCLAKNLWAFVVFCGLNGLCLAASGVYIRSQMTSMERHFRVSTGKMGILMAANDIGALGSVMIASHFGKFAHIPRLIAVLTVASGLSVCALALVQAFDPLTLPSVVQSEDASGSSSNPMEIMLKNPMLLCNDFAFLSSLGMSGKGLTGNPSGDVSGMDLAAMMAKNSEGVPGMTASSSGPMNATSSVGPGPDMAAMMEKMGMQPSDGTGIDMAALMEMMKNPSDQSSNIDMAALMDMVGNPAGGGTGMDMAAMMEMMASPAGAGGNMSGAPNLPGMNMDMFAMSGMTGHIYEQSTHWGFYFALALLIVCGALGSPRMPLQLYYVETNVKNKADTGVKIGALNTAMMFGGPLALLLGSLIGMLPVDLSDSQMSFLDPRYIGAWWLGFVVFGGATVVFALPLFCLPRNIRSEQVEKNSPSTEKRHSKTLDDKNIALKGSSTQESNNLSRRSSHRPSNASQLSRLGTTARSGMRKFKALKPLPPVRHEPSQPYTRLATALRCLVLLACAVWPTCDAQHTGRSFVVAFPLNMDIMKTQAHFVSISNVGGDIANVVISTPSVEQGPLNIELTAGEERIYILLTDSFSGIFLPTSTSGGAAVRLTSNQDIVIVAHSMINEDNLWTNGCHLLFPDDRLGTEYVVVTECAANNCFILVVAANEEAEVIVQLRLNYPRSLPNTGATLQVQFSGQFYVHGDQIVQNLPAYQFMQVLAEEIDMSGSRVSSNAPVALICGGDFTTVLRGSEQDTDPQGMVMDQPPPLAELGKKYTLVSFPDIEDETLVKVVYTKENTLRLNPSDPLDSGSEDLKIPLSQEGVRTNEYEYLLLSSGASTILTYDQSVLVMLMPPIHIQPPSPYYGTGGVILSPVTSWGTDYHMAMSQGQTTLVLMTQFWSVSEFWFVHPDFSLNGRDIDIDWTLSEDSRFVFATLRTDDFPSFINISSSVNFGGYLFYMDPGKACVCSLGWHIKANDTQGQSSLTTNAASTYPDRLNYVSMAYEIKKTTTESRPENIDSTLDSDSSVEEEVWGMSSSSSHRSYETLDTTKFSSAPAVMDETLDTTKFSSAPAVMDETLDTTKFSSLPGVMDETLDTTKFSSAPAVMDETLDTTKFSSASAVMGETLDTTMSFSPSVNTAHHTMSSNSPLETIKALMSSSSSLETIDTTIPLNSQLEKADTTTSSGSPLESVDTTVSSSSLLETIDTTVSFSSPLVNYETRDTTLSKEDDVSSKISPSRSGLNHENYDSTSSNSHHEYNSDSASCISVGVTKDISLQTEGTSYAESQETSLMNHLASTGSPEKHQTSEQNAIMTTKRDRGFEYTTKFRRKDGDNTSETSNQKYEQTTSSLTTTTFERTASAPALCPCPCRVRQDWYHVLRNRTVLEAMLENKIKILQLSRVSLSSRRRRLTSAVNNHVAAVPVGAAFSVIILVCVVVFIIFLDLPRLYAIAWPFIRHAKRRFWNIM